MDTLVLDGKRYVKASEAARDAGYTSDYVGQLCRSGKIDAHFVGRTWYVNIDHLGSHRIDSKRNSRVKAREQVKKALEERQANTGLREMKNFEKYQIRYEEDENNLLPEVRKISVESEVKPPRKISDTKDISDKQDKNYTIENEGRKILMSGSVKVVDVTDADLLDSDTIFLQARIARKSKKISEGTRARAKEDLFHTTGEHKKTLKVMDEDGAASIDLEKSITRSTDTKIDFATRLQELEVVNDIPVKKALEIEETPKNVDSTTSFTRVLQISVVVVSLFLALSTMLQSSWKYDEANEDETILSEYSIDTQSLVEVIASKI